MGWDLRILREQKSYSPIPVLLGSLPFLLASNYLRGGASGPQTFVGLWQSSESCPFMEAEEGSIRVLLQVPRARLAELRGSCWAVGGRVKRKGEMRHTEFRG